MTQQSIERGELIVHRDAQSLENAANGQCRVPLRFARGSAARMALPNECVRSKCLPASAGASTAACGSSAFSMSSLASFSADKLARKVRSRLSALRIHPQVERPVVFRGEAARGIVQLHRGNAEIREDDVGAVEPVARQRLRQAGEVAPGHLQHRSVVA